MSFDEIQKQECVLLMNDEMNAIDYIDYKSYHFEDNAEAMAVLEHIKKEKIKAIHLYASLLAKYSDDDGDTDEITADELKAVLDAPIDETATAEAFDDFVENLRE